MKNLLCLILLMSNLYSFADKQDSLFLVLDTVSNTRKSFVLKEIGTSYLQQANYIKAIEYYNEGLNIAENNNNKEEMLNNLNNIGHVYSVLGNLQKSLDAYIGALKYVRQVGDLRKECIILQGIATIFFDLKDYENTNKYLQAALIIANTIDDSNEKSAILNLLGSNSPKGSVASYNYYINSLEIAKSIQDTVLILVITANLGNYYSVIKQYDKAIKNYELAISYISTSNPEWFSGLLLNIGRNQFEMKKINESIINCKKALIIAMEYGLLREEKESCGCLSDNYYEIKDFEKAYQYHIQFIAARDSSTNNNITRLSTKLEMQFEFEKIQFQDSIKWIQQKELINAKVKNRESWLVFVVIALLFAILFIIIFFVQKRMMLKSNNQLVTRNLELINSEKQLQSFKQNNKVKIIEKKEKYSNSSLTVIQKEDIKNEIIKKMEDEKIFTNKNISSNIFAKEIGTNKKYLSEVINSEFNKSFVNFINEYRIKEARTQLADKKNENLTIESIALGVGFKTRSTFNVAFKKFTGITPSFFLKSVKNVST